MIKCNCGREFKKRSDYISHYYITQPSLTIKNREQDEILREQHKEQHKERK